jgi:hypothetical protein
MLSASQFPPQQEDLSSFFFPNSDIFILSFTS